MFQVTSTIHHMGYTNPSYSNALGVLSTVQKLGGKPSGTREWMIFRVEADSILSRGSDIGWQKQIASSFLTVGSFRLIQTRNVAAMFHVDLIQDIQFLVLTPRWTPDTEASVTEHYLFPKMTSQVVGENCIMRSCMVCTLHPVLLGWSKQGGWDGRGTWRAWGRWEVHTTFWLGGLKGGDH
jgi:hypothetical protein